MDSRTLRYLRMAAYGEAKRRFLLIRARAFCGFGNDGRSFVVLSKTSAMAPSFSHIRLTPADDVERSRRVDRTFPFRGQCLSVGMDGRDQAGP